jgi:hypothetical protein
MVKHINKGFITVGCLSLLMAFTSTAIERAAGASCSRSGGCGSCACDTDRSCGSDLNHRGSVGPRGMQGVAGLAGATGATGSCLDCPQGPTGATGTTGAQGEVGFTGVTGTTGTQGLVGFTGVTGTTGTQGLVGVTGTTGTQGEVGLTGATGAQGPAGGVAGYGYIYALIPQTVAINAPVLFDSNGPLLGVTHGLGSDAIAIVSAGTYLVTFSASGTEPNQFTIYVNGAPDPSTTYGSGAGTQQNTGSAILVLAAGDILTLVNHSSAAAVTLASIVGGTEANVTASVTIIRLA